MGVLRRQMALPLHLLLAFRYLKSGRKDAYVSLLSALAGGGIALGVAALILVMAGLSGLQDYLRSDVLSRTPHLEIALPRAGASADTVDAVALVDTLRDVPGVVDARRLIRSRGWLLIGGGVVDVAVVGYDGELPSFFPEATTRSLLASGGGFGGGGFGGGGFGAGRVESEDLTTEGGGDARGLFLGDTVAIRWGLDVGDRLELVSARPTLTPFGPQPRSSQLAIRGTFATGRLEEGQPRIAIPLEVARRLFGDRRMRVELRADDLDGALELARRVEPLLPEGSRVETWQDLNRGLFFALQLEKMLLFVSVFLIVPVAAMALVTVLALLISSKRAEIGMLQAMGARQDVLRRAFTTLGLLLGTLGLTLGTVLGTGLAWLFDRYQLLRPPGNVYLLDHIPFLVLPRDLITVLLATFTLTLGSTLYAARKAAATQPVEALRQ